MFLAENWPGLVIIVYRKISVRKRLKMLSAGNS